MSEQPEEHYKISYYTASIYQWKELLKPDKYKDIIHNSLQFLIDKKRIKLYAFVIMPNHIHLLWKIIPPWTLKVVQKDFMKFTGQKIKFDLIDNHPDLLEKYFVESKDRKCQFWQRNSLNDFCDSREYVEQKLDYIHNNPCQGKWMLANSPLDYKYSSIRFYECDEMEYNFLSHYMECFE